MEDHPAEDDLGRLTSICERLRASIATRGRADLVIGARKPTLKRQYGWDCTRLDDVGVHEPGYMGSSPTNPIKISALPSYYSTA